MIQIFLPAVLLGAYPQVGWHLFEGTIMLHKNLGDSRVYRCCSVPVASEVHDRETKNLQLGRRKK
jgi:hypothetical protein